MKRTGITKQGRMFKTAARTIGCDESKSLFEKKLRQIAKAEPKPKKQKPAVK